MVCVAVASNRRVPLDVRMTLSSDASADVRMVLALNINALEQAKLRLVYDKNHDVRLRLAKCGYMFPSVLKILAQDPVDEVRQLVAVNYNATPEILTMFINDAEPRLQQSAKSHPDFTPEKVKAMQ